MLWGALLSRVCNKDPPTGSVFPQIVPLVGRTGTATRRAPGCCGFTYFPLFFLSFLFVCFVFEQSASTNVLLTLMYCGHDGSTRRKKTWLILPGYPLPMASTLTPNQRAHLLLRKGSAWCYSTGYMWTSWSDVCNVGLVAQLFFPSGSTQAMLHWNVAGLPEDDKMEPLSSSFLMFS